MVDTYAIFWLSPVGFGTISTEVWHLLDAFQMIAVTLDIAILHRSCFLSLDCLDRPWQLYLTTVLWCSRSLVLSLVQFLIAKNLVNRTLIFWSWFVGWPGLPQSWTVTLFQIDSCHRTQSFMNRDITHSVIHVIAIEHLLALSPMNDWLVLLFCSHLVSSYHLDMYPCMYFTNTLRKKTIMVNKKPLCLWSTIFGCVLFEQWCCQVLCKYIAAVLFTWHPFNMHKLCQFQISQ